MVKPITAGNSAILFACQRVVPKTLRRSDLKTYLYVKLLVHDVASAVELTAI